MVSLLAVVIAAVSYWGSGGIYSGLGRGDLDMERDRPVAAASAAEAQEEIRQMLQAKSDRREARGEAPIDIEAELASLSSAPRASDPALREEVRQLVLARNERRVEAALHPQMSQPAQVARPVRAAFEHDCRLQQAERACRIATTEERAGAQNRQPEPLGHDITR